MTELMEMPFAEMEKGVGRGDHNVSDMLNLRFFLNIQVEIF